MNHWPQMLRLSGPSRLFAALVLLAAMAPAEVGQAFTPTVDGRFIHVNAAGSPETLTPVPFQPFSALLQRHSAGTLVLASSQTSSFLADGVTGSGSAFAEFAPFSSAQSLLDTTFDLTDSAAFSLQGSLTVVSPGATVTIVLERISPNPAVLISENGTNTFDQLVGLPVGTYRLAVDADLGSTDGESEYDIGFLRVCSSPDPTDTDSDSFVDACDICPVDFDPDQVDTDGDGIGDVCNDGVDADGDDYADTLDNCPSISNPGQEDADFDTLGDVCDDPEVIKQVLDPSGLNIASPTRVALAADGTAYVAAPSTSNVFRVLPSGGVSELFDGVPVGANVVDVAVAPDGFVYTAGGASADCYKIDPLTGAATLFIDGQGDGLGALLQNANRVVVANDGRVFVSGTDSDNVFEVAANGIIVEVLDSTGDGTLPATDLTALEVDAAGNLYALNGPTDFFPWVFRVAPDHQVSLYEMLFPLGMRGRDMALGQDGSVYLGGDGIAVRRPSGLVEELLPASDPSDVVALDVDALDVIHAVQSSASLDPFRLTPAGEIAELIDATGDGQGNPLTNASDVAVSDGPVKRIVVLGRDSMNLFLIADAVATQVPLFGPISMGVVAVAILGVPVRRRRRRRCQ